ncbi:MAG: YicC/YloC family endoribonuclease, partial [Vicinamibacterales bacterium]
MITSMTGFASVSRERDEVAVGVTVKAVNHRFFDVQIRMPASLSVAEPTIRSLAQKAVARGRVEISVSVNDRRRRAVEVSVNEALIAGVSAALQPLRASGQIAGELTVSDLMRLPDALVVTEAAADASAEAHLVALSGEAVEVALESLIVMRRR